ncbi:MAG TPA: PKD domain-containing protein [Candidatus Saccharimonadales bacterium]|nr:PKD domain-containing protein [Candidatus Saccharimonadales bacterium]
MKFLSKIKRLVRKPIVAATVAAATFGVAAWLVTPAPTHAADCDSNAVIRCGVNSINDVQNAYSGSVKQIYNCMGISTSDINNMSKGLDSNGTGVVEGTVNTQGQVIVNGDVVATGALTGGRQNMPGSTNRTADCGTSFYQRPPSVSFQQSSLSALVDMKNGVFQFAIINSCGNPVKATPKTPGYKVTKLVSIKGKGDFQNNVTVNSGDHVEYKIIVESNGQVAAKNITVTDDLPKDMKEVSGSMQRIDRNGNSSPASDTNLFNGGATIDSLPVGDKVTFKFEAIAGNTSTPTSAQCTEEHLVNTASINSPALPKESNNASVDTLCKVQVSPNFSCDSLTANPAGGNAFNFTANATANNGAKITGYKYSFGDGQTITNQSTSSSNSTSHTYAPGNYTASVTVNFDVNGTAKTATSANCQKQISLTPVTPVFTCDSLTATPLSRTQYSFTANASASNGATITGYTYNFGDGQSVTSTTAATSNTVSHNYAPGNYTATVTANFTVNGTAKTATSAACQKPITVGQAPAAECTGLTAVAAANNPLTYTAQANYTTANGATLTSASLDWGDNTVTASNNSGSGVAGWAPHTYAKAGNYTLTATLNFSSPDTTIAPSTCKTQVTINGPQVTVACNALTFTKGDNNSLTVTLTGLQTSVNPAGSATFTNADITWGDGTSNNGVANVNGLAHKYATAGNYSITAVAHFNVNGTDVKQGGAGCVVPVSFTATPPPTQLVNTGAGSVFGLFAGVSFLGSLIYRFFLGRRLGQEV